MKIFERITKRYALQNYYLRRNFYWPDTLPEILDYWQQHNDLPFLYGGDNWPYDAMCERQRRKGVYASQYLTPDRTACQMAALAVRYFDNDSRIVGAANLNLLLQQALNPSGPSLGRGGYTYRQGDRVMQLRNNYAKEVFNGDQGYIREVDTEDRMLTVDFDGKKVEYDVTELDELTLAYATTIHKAQGSEYPIVVMPVLMTHFVMLQRNLIYTNASIPKLLRCGCNFMRSTSAARTSLPIRRSRLWSVSTSCNGSPARNARAIVPCCFCRTALSTSSVPKPYRRRCGTLSSTTGHPCRSRSHALPAVRRSS